MRNIEKILVLLAALSVANICFAGGCLPGEDCYEEPAEPVIQERPAPVPVEECSGWGSRLSGGAPIWFFQEEDTEVGGGIYYDRYSKCRPINFRIGAEVAHIDADQPNAILSGERPGSQANITFVRIPFAIEYMTNIAENTLLFAGLGPDIVNTANDISDTTVGLHLSARLHHNFSENWGIAVEAGYAWVEVEDGNGDVDLDNAFIIPTLAYTF